MIYGPDDKPLPRVKTPLEVWYSKRTLEMLRDKFRLSDLWGSAPIRPGEQSTPDPTGRAHLAPRSKPKATGYRSAQHAKRQARTPGVGSHLGPSWPRWLICQPLGLSRSGARSLGQTT